MSAGCSRRGGDRRLPRACRCTKTSCAGCCAPIGWQRLLGERAAFTSDDEALLLSGNTAHLARLRVERVFAAVERSRYEHERLYAASKLLNRALTPEEVHRTAFAAVSEICAFDFAALTHYDEAARRQPVIAGGWRGGADGGEPAAQLCRQRRAVRDGGETA